MLKETCPCCGQAIMRHRHSLNRPLCDILMIMAQKHKAGVPFHLNRDIMLTKFQYNNAQKLRYWGLIKKTELNGKRVSGFWELTGLAKAFLNHKPLPLWKKTFNNKVVEASEELIQLEDVIGSYELPVEWAEKAEPVRVFQDTLFK